MANGRNLGAANLAASQHGAGVLESVNGLFERWKPSRPVSKRAMPVRALVGRIVVSGEDGNAELWLKGDLAGILTPADRRKTPADPGDERVLPSLVAGVGFEPTTFRL